MESGDDDGRESDDFADDEDDELSMAESSINGDDIEETDEDTRYLSEPTYNNLDPAWIHSLNKVTTLPPVGYLQSKISELRDYSQVAFSETKINTNSFFRHPSSATFSQKSLLCA